MAQPPLHYQHRLDLASTPAELWEYIADTDRLNHDIGFSPITILDTGDLTNSRKTAQQQVQGFLTQQWTEEPFQWVKPYTYQTYRNYSKGLFEGIRQHVLMTPTDDGGTHIDYQMWVDVRHNLLRPLINASFSRMDFPGVFRQYDAQIQKQRLEVSITPFLSITPVVLAEGASGRLQILSERLVESGAEPEVVEKLVDYLTYASDLDVMNFQPYALADRWNEPRLSVLEACLLATRVGLLDMSWDLLCPLCRGAKVRVSNLTDITQSVHCEVCLIDYTANFEQSVELTFKPSSQIREITASEYCVGGPEVTPHIEAQQLLTPGESRTISGKLPSGRYRVRAVGLPGGQYLRIKPGMDDRVTLRASQLDGWQQDEPYVRPEANITLVNATDGEQLFVMEHLAWGDQAATAADVTTRQTFRDLFASEALRPNEQITVNNLTFVFTDLRASTQLYREVGDAPAFGLVMQHFDIMREFIREEGGAIVKTIGDAVMAVFNQPDHAVRAMMRAHAAIAEPESLGRVIQLRVGIHTGKAIAVTLNERLDYFGTTVNIAARLEGQSDGTNLVLSDVVYQDPSVQELLSSLGDEVLAEHFQTELKGLGEESFRLWRLQAAPSLLPDEVAEL